MKHISLWIGLCLLGQARLFAADLEGDFHRPPPAARPWVYWYFMDGNLSREGMTADLAAMKQAGIGGVQRRPVSWGILEPRPAVIPGDRAVGRQRVGGRNAGQRDRAVDR